MPSAGRKYDYSQESLANNPRDLQKEARDLAEGISVPNARNGRRKWRRVSVTWLADVATEIQRLRDEVKEVRQENSTLHQGIEEEIRAKYDADNPLNSEYDFADFD